MKKLSLMAILCSFLLFTGCTIGNVHISIDEKDGSGTKDTRTYTLSKDTAAGFRIDDLITVGVGTGKVSVSLTASGEPEIKITTDDNILDDLTVDTKDDEIRIKGKHGLNYDTDGIDIAVTGVTFKDATFVFSGNTSVTSDDCITGNFEFTANGAIDGMLTLSTGSANIVFNGTTSLSLTGKADNLKITMNGAGKCDSTKLISNDAKIVINGAGSASVYAKDTLDISINGAGSVDYLGAPSISQRINGLGSVKKAED